MFDAQDIRLEYVSSVIDYLKHLTTLSTGSIVLMATFWEKLSAKPEWKSAVTISITGFIVSILSASIVHTFFVLFVLPGKEEPEVIKFVGGMSLLFTWSGFLAGVVGLAAFTIKNVPRK